MTETKASKMKKEKGTNISLKSLSIYVFNGFIFPYSQRKKMALN